MIGINTGILSTVVAPFGGIKSAGFEREGSGYGIDEYTELKHLSLGAISAGWSAPRGQLQEASAGGDKR